MIEVKNVTKSYGSGESKNEVLKGISTSIEDGGFTVILGTSGSGKSTFLNVVSGLERPDGGSILYDGEDITKLSDAKMTEFRKENIGFIFQQYYLLPHMTVEKNVKMGGEQQRVSVARALAKRPKILFLDEPTGALDENTGRQVPEYKFDVEAMVISLVAFAIVYEAFMYFGMARIRKVSIREIMLES